MVRHCFSTKKEQIRKAKKNGTLSLSSAPHSDYLSTSSFSCQHGFNQAQVFRLYGVGFPRIVLSLIGSQTVTRSSSADPSLDKTAERFFDAPNHVDTSSQPGCTLRKAERLCLNEAAFPEIVCPIFGFHKVTCSSSVVRRASSLGQETSERLSQGGRRSSPGSWAGGV